MDDVVVDVEHVTDALRLRDRRSPLLVPVVEIEDPDVKVGWVVSLRLPFRRFELRDLIGFTVFPSGLLDASAADVELVAHKLCVQFVIKNALTDPFNIILDQVHLSSWTEGKNADEIFPR